MNKIRKGFFNIFYKMFWYKYWLGVSWNKAVIYRTFCDARNLARTNFMIELGKQFPLSSTNKTGRMQKLSGEDSEKKKACMIIKGTPDPVGVALRESLNKDIPKLPLDKSDI